MLDQPKTFRVAQQIEILDPLQNQETFHPFEPTAPGSGAVVVWGEGFAVEILALLYWGDLDSAGFCHPPPSSSLTSGVAHGAVCADGSGHSG